MGLILLGVNSDLLNELLSWDSLLSPKLDKLSESLPAVGGKNSQDSEMSSVFRLVNLSHTVDGSSVTLVVDLLEVKFVVASPDSVIVSVVDSMPSGV